MAAVRTPALRSGTAAFPAKFKLPGLVDNSVFLIQIDRSVIALGAAPGVGLMISALRAGKVIDLIVCIEVIVIHAVTSPLIETPAPISTSKVKSTLNTRWRPAQGTISLKGIGRRKRNPYGPKK